MRRSAAAFALALAAFAPAIAAAQTVTAPLGRVVRVPLAGAAADVVVGNPRIADVTVVSPTALFVSGKGYGATNVIVMDRTGRTIFNGMIQVPVPNDGQVSVLRGGRAATYFCAPNCDRALDEEAEATDIAAAAALSTSDAPAQRASPGPAATAALLR